MKTEIQVEPCPFFGCEATVSSEDGGWDCCGRNIYEAVCGCERCSAIVSLTYYGDDLLEDDEDGDEGCRELERRAAAIWNRRAHDGHDRSRDINPCLTCVTPAETCVEPAGLGEDGRLRYRAYCGCRENRCGNGVEITGACDDDAEFHELKSRATAEWNRRMDRIADETSDLEDCPFCECKAISFSEVEHKGGLLDDIEYRAYCGCANPECGIGVELFHAGRDLQRDGETDTCRELERRAKNIWNHRVETPAPCPVCGDEAETYSERTGRDKDGENTYRAYAGCFGNLCGGGVELTHTGDDLQQEGETDTCKALERRAIAEWNRRVEDTPDHVPDAGKKDRHEQGSEE